MEADKLVTSILISGTTMWGIHFQSSSIDLLSIDTSTFTGNLLGTPKKTVITNSSIAGLYPGAYAFGRSDELDCSNSVIGSMTGREVAYKSPDASFTISNGVIVIPNTLGAVAASWAVPRTNLTWADGDRSSVSISRWST